MKLRLVVALALVAVVGITGCRRAAPEAAPAPVTQSTDDGSARARADSIAAAELARRQAEERELRAQMARAQEVLSNVVHFEYDSDELSADARANLDEKIRILNANPAVRIRIEGHCDERGTDEYNLVLGRRRAEQAKRYLTDRGIDASRIETMSFGRERPIAQGSGEEAWSQNRRDDFNIVAGGENLRPVG